VPGIQPSANAGASSEMDPGNKCRDDSCWCQLSVANPTVP
jgi:hypothetical protein